MKMFKESLLALGTAGALACAGIAQAQANLLINGSFEDTNGTFVQNSAGIMDLAGNSTVIPGWTASGYSISWVRGDNPFGLTTPSGQFLLDLTGPSDTGFGYIEQTFATPTGPYHVSFDMGANNSCSGFDCTGPMTIRVNVAGVEREFTGFDPAGAGMHWGTFGMDFTATSPSTTLRLSALSAAGGSVQFRGLDNAVVTVPEPETYAMMLVGLAIVGFVAGRRRPAQRGSAPTVARPH